MKKLSQQNYQNKYMKRVTTAFCLMLSLGILGVGSASAASYSIFPTISASCYGNDAASIDISISLEKSVYAPNETATAFGSVASDDYPCTNYVYASLQMTAAQAYSKIDANVVAQDLRDGILFSNFTVGTAPATPGSYSAKTAVGANTYTGANNQTVSYKVVSVTLNFSFLDKVKELLNDSFLDKAFAGVR